MTSTSATLFMEGRAGVFDDPIIKNTDLCILHIRLSKQMLELCSK